MHDGAAQVDKTPGADLVRVPGNPAPDGAEIIWYEGKGGLRLRLLYAPARGEPRALALVCPGRTEFIEKYFEVVRDLQKRGFAIALFDWPGQGLSDRPMKDPMRGHIRSFDWYVDALTRGIATLGDRALPKQVVLAHSMGGAVALEAMRRREIRPVAAAFSAPMWGIPIWFFQRWYAYLARFCGLGGLPARPPQPP
jgi:lysophospholipase